MSKIPGYLHFKPRNLARVKINGRIIYLGPYGSPESYRAYERVIAEYLVSKQAPPPDDQTPMSVAEVCQAYFDAAKDEYGDNGYTPAHRHKAALDDVCELYGDIPAIAFGPLKLKAVRQQWIDSGLTRVTINQKVREVRRAFRWAASCELIPETVHAKLATTEGLRQGRCKAKESRRVPPVPDAVVERTLKHLPPVLQAMVRIQRLTGARPAEVCRMRPCDIDRSGDAWLYRPSRHKTQHHGIERVIAIGPKAQAVLRPYLLRDKQAPCFSPLEAVDQWLDAKHARRKTPESCGNVPTGSRDKRIRPYYTPDTYRRAIDRVCDKHDIPRWAPNQLRHTRLTEVRAKHGYEAAMTTGGHETDVTRIYAERNLNLAITVALQSG